MYTKIAMCKDYSKPKKIIHTPFGVIELKPTIPIYYGVALWCNGSQIKNDKKCGNNGENKDDGKDDKNMQHSILY